MMAGRKSINDFIKYFCKEYSVDFCHDKTISSCPCRFKIRSIEFCNFNQRIINLNPVKEALKYKKFLKSICKNNRDLLEKRNIISIDIQNRMRSVVSDIESGKIKLGDIVYCTKLGREVILIEFPKKENFDTYHKFGVFPGDIKYKTLNNEVGLAPVTCINRVSRGNYTAEFEVLGKDKKSKERVDQLEGDAKRMGFRVRIIETKRSYKLEFIGDTQQEVDDFVQVCDLPEFSF